MCKRILCVEDDYQSALLLKCILQSQGYEALFVEDGEDAINLAVHEMPDLILMDIFLPGMDGLEVTDLLKSMPETAHIPVIAVTACPPHNPHYRSLSSYFTDYQAKPFLPNDLLNRIKQALNS